MTRPLRVVLGPQRHRPCVREALESVALDARGPVALITAGWEEREGEDEELREHLGVRAHNLGLYERAERLFEEDPALFAALRARHDRMRRLQEVYRLRLSHALASARELLARRRAGAGDEDLLEPAIASAIRAVADLDAHHAERLAEVHAAFEDETRPGEHPAVARAREELRARLSECAAVCLAGGHVAILLNRLRLFDLSPALAERPVIAWSAGAMVLSERVVVFHDSPPQGPGDAEVLEVGLGLLPDLVPLPHATRRLRLDDADRVELFARRFGPALCLALDEGARADLADLAHSERGRWRVKPGTRRLSPEGSLVEAGVVGGSV